MSEETSKLSRRSFLKGATVSTFAVAGAAALAGCASENNDGLTTEVETAKTIAQDAQQKLELTLAEVRLINDRFEIMDCQYKYARGIDSKDLAILTDAFAETIDVYYPLTGTKIDAIEGAAMAQGLIGGMDGIVTQHSMTNFMITVDGDTATAITYLRAMHKKPDAAAYEVGGYYENTYMRTDQGWKIKTVTLNNTYELGETYFGR